MALRHPAEMKLREIGAMPDAAIDLAEGALAFAALDRPGLDLDSYRGHLAALARGVGDAVRAAGALDRVAVLRRILVEENGYTGDRDSYDDLQNADLTHVIDRRRGLPVALAILWLHAARAQGWAADGINFPGHFLIRLDTGGEYAIVDPFHNGTPLEAPALRLLLKRLVGDEAELTPAYYAPMPNRAILLRLENNIRMRLVRRDQHGAALSVLERMLLIAPKDAGLWRDAGALQAEMGNLRAAIASLDRALALADGRLRQRVAQDLDKLRIRLH